MPAVLSIQARTRVDAPGSQFPLPSVGITLQQAPHHLPEVPSSRQWPHWAPAAQVQFAWWGTHLSAALLSPAHPPLPSQIPSDLLWFSRSVTSDSFATQWTIACQAPLSVGFPRQEYWSRLPFPSPGHLPDPRTELASLTWQIEFLPLSHQESPKPWGHLQINYQQSTLGLESCPQGKANSLKVFFWRILKLLFFYFNMEKGPGFFLQNQSCVSSYKWTNEQIYSWCDDSGLKFPYQTSWAPL